MGSYKGILTAKALAIVGANHLQNSLLASFIESELTIPCNVYKFARNLPRHNLDCANTLILLDCGSDQESYVAKELERLVERLPGLDVALFNMRQDSPLERLAAVEGIKGIFYEDVSQQQLITGLCKIFLGELWFSRKVISAYLVKKRERLRTTATDNALTRREKEIIGLIATGAKNTEIADTLCLSTHTVKTHIYHIFKKINVKNRLQASNWATKNL